MAPISLLPAQKAQLQTYADLVWDKRTALNLTSVRTRQEIWDRHICDGLAAAAVIGGNPVQIADYGAGAGYIGLTLAAALPQAQVTLIESLQKRCQFMDWAAYKAGIKNVKVLNMRAGDGPPNEIYDFTTQRAMGKIVDVLPLCTRDLKPGGVFIAYLAVDDNPAPAPGIEVEKEVLYTLPGQARERKLLLLRKV